MKNPGKLSTRTRMPPERFLYSHDMTKAGWSVQRRSRRLGAPPTNGMGEAEIEVSFLEDLKPT